MPKPVEPPPPPSEIKTNEELYLAGLRLEQFHSPAMEPYPYYEEALRRDPGDSRVNVALAILYCKRGMFAEAEKHLNAAIERITRNYTSPKDGEAFYYLGVALRFQGKFDAAETAFHKAAWSQAWYGPSYYQLAELACGREEFERALEFVDRAVSVNPLNTKALALQGGLFFKIPESKLVDRFPPHLKGKGLGAAFYVMFGGLWSADPLVGPPYDDVESHRGKRRWRDDVECLECAVDTAACGDWMGAAGALLDYVAAVDDKTRVNPLIRYHLAYYLEQRGDDRAKEQYLLAAQMPPDYCFPFQWESAEILQHAMKMNPADARAPYYLGNLLFDLQPKKAIEAWERSRELDPAFATAHRNLGLAYAQVENDLPKAVASLEKAVACDPRDPRLFAELDAASEAAGVDPMKRLAVLEKNHQVVAERDDALLREITLDLLAGKYGRAIELLDHHFHLWEGQTGIHDVYVDAHLLRGQQHFKARQYAEALKDYEACLEYPDRFETGRPRRAADKAAEIHYFLGMAYEALRDGAQARQHFDQAVRARPGWSEAGYYQALAYRKLGQDARAVEVFDGLIRSGRQRLAAPAKVDFFAKFGFQQSDRVAQGAGALPHRLGPPRKRRAGRGEGGVPEGRRAGRESSRGADDVEGRGGGG